MSTESHVMKSSLDSNAIFAFPGGVSAKELGYEAEVWEQFCVVCRATRWNTRLGRGRARARSLANGNTVCLVESVVPHSPVPRTRSARTNCGTMDEGL